MAKKLVYVCLAGFMLFLGGLSTVFAEGFLSATSGSQEVTFFRPSGLKGFIVYDVDPKNSMNEVSYGKQTFDLSAELGLPLAIDVERFKFGNGSYGFQKLLEETESDFLEIFSIENVLSYSPKSTLSPFYPRSRDISMVVATANYQATERFSAKLSTGLSQRLEETSGSSSSNLGYEIDIAGLYEIAPGLSFSVGAGYSANTDILNDQKEDEEEQRSWSFISKLKMLF
ncbi:MAG: hypothetical protein R3231_01540 [bacterium]|nr:hypothetical protein [bacterium]